MSGFSLITITIHSQTKTTY